MIKPLRIGIIGGEGKMGRLFDGLFLKQGHEVLISDKNTVLDNENLLKKVEVVLLSVPIDKTVQVIKEISPWIREEQLVIDLTSVKKAAVQALKKTMGQIISVHPMFNDFSFGQGQTVIVCRVRASWKWHDWLTNFLKKAGLIIEEMEVLEHDRMMSVIQGLSHFTDIIFGKTLEKIGIKIKDLLPYASSAYEIKILMAARILAQDANLYAQIQTQNPNVKKVLNTYLKAAQDLSQIVANKDVAGFVKYFQQSSAYFGTYCKSALKDSDWLIAQMLEKRIRQKVIIEKPKASGDVSLLGPAHTYSDIATNYWINNFQPQFKEATKLYCTSISEVFEKVASGKAQYGIVPIENSLDGTIQETFDNLFEKNLFITRELAIPIHLSLAVLPQSRTEDIKMILSHPKALNQCRNFLKQNFPNMESGHFLSTAAAMQYIVDRRLADTAAIGNSEAAQSLGLKILKNNIEDNFNNQTHFVVIEKKERKPNLKIKEFLKTSLAFYFGENKPGLLYDIFREFAINRVNLTRIESRPSKREYGDYIFYLDFAGNIYDKKSKAIVKKISKDVKKLKYFGCYPYLGNL